MLGRRTLYVHIGMHKTGTTSIQRALHDLSDQLFIRDFLYPMAGRHPREYRSHALLPHLLGMKVPDHGPMSLVGEIDHEAMLRALRNEVDLSGRSSIVLSSEDLWNVSVAGIEKLGQVFHDFDIIPIIFVRHPALFAQSLYNTMIRYGHINRIELEQKKNFWFWLCNFEVLSIVERWSAISSDRKIVVVDYDLLKGGSCEVFFDIIGLPASVLAMAKVQRENVSEAPVITFVRQELLLSGMGGEMIERLVKQLSPFLVPEFQTLIPEGHLSEISTSYSRQCIDIRSSSRVRLVQDGAFGFSSFKEQPVYIGTMNGVVFALGRSLARSKGNNDQRG